MYELLNFQLWMWKYSGIGHWSHLSEPTHYENSPMSGWMIQHTLITGNSAQHRMNGRLSIYVMDVLREIQFWTLQMSKRHMVTLYPVITVYNDMFSHMDGVMPALAKKKTQWKEDLYLAVKCAQQKLSK